MKSKIVILGVCAVLSGCGVDKRGEGNVHARLQLSNLRVNSYAKANLSETGEAYYHLGTYDLSELPEEMKKLPSGSEIGTLAVEYASEVYASEYTAEIKPTVNKWVDESLAPIYLVKEPGSMQLVSLAIKKSEKFKLNASNEPVKVKHQPKRYCSQAHFYIVQLKDKIAILDQHVPCYPDETCDARLTIEFPSNRDSIFKFNLKTNQPFNLPHSCDHEETAWAEETRINRSVPTKAVVSLLSVYSHVYRQLGFTL